MANTGLNERRTTDTLCVPLPDLDKTSVKSKRKLRLRLPYIINIIIGVVVTILLIITELGYIPQTKLGYYCKDPSLSHSFRGDSVSMGLLLFGCTLGPLIILALIEIDRHNAVSKNCGGIIWKWYKEFFVGLTGVFTFVEVAKLVTGEHRPHFLTTCSPDAEDTCTPGEFIRDYKCLNQYFSRYIIIDSSRSFPSGHAAGSVYAAIYCAAFIQQRFDTRKYGYLLKKLGIVLCLIWGVVCSLTRIVDRRHHWWDVLAGSVLGIAVAYYVVAITCKHFNSPPKSSSTPRSSPSTTTLLDAKNKSSTSVMI